MTQAEAAKSLLIRPVCMGDVEELLSLAVLLDTMNLPRDRAVIEGMIAASETAFDRLNDAGAETIPTSYTLVATDGDRLLGTSSLLSHHGSPQDPHYYLSVQERTLRSEQLDVERTRHVLQLEQDQSPWTEFGGLIVHPDARGQGLGKLLVAARMLLIAMFPDRFCERLLAELLPERRPDGGNAFWDALGGKLTGLNYYRADSLCRSDKEFIETLFPKYEIALELLPPEAQSIVGRVGPATEPARRLYERAGFEYQNTVDPFDGGPHFGALVRSVEPIRSSRSLVCLDLPPSETETISLLGNPYSLRFCATHCQRCRHGLRLNAADKARLDVAAGDQIHAMPLDW